MSRKPLAMCVLVITLIAVAAVFFERNRRAKLGRVEEIIAVYDQKFRCTVYYTPRETGFTKERGFDVSPETRKGLKEHEYPRDFLLAVEKEGFGRIKNPIEGKNYIRYYSGTWGFAEKPIDNRQQPLVPRQSCALSQKQKLLTPLSRVRIRTTASNADFEALRWVVADTGSELDEWQIDLYWGEDDPAGPSKQRTRPMTAPAELANATITVLRNLAAPTGFEPVHRP